MAAKRRDENRRFYDPGQIEDAPEFHEIATALGLLTWGTWDDGIRPVALRISDFVAAFPPDAPTRYSGGSLVRRSDGLFEPGSKSSRLERFSAKDWRSGSVYEVLSRYGLRLRDAPQRVDRQFVADSLHDTAKRRNVKLRVLHGGVDIEPGNMDAAKAAYLDRREKERAALDVRAARERMRQELKDDGEGG
jgi:hypothetical protein